MPLLFASKLNPSLHRLSVLTCHIKQYPFVHTALIRESNVLVSSTRCASTDISVMSGINPDGTLIKYDLPTPSTPASIAAATGDVTTLSSAEVKTFLWEKDEYDNTPLIWAADQGHVDALEYILSEIPSPSSSDNSSDNGKDEGTVDINTSGYLGNTAISRAARGGHLSCVQLLLTGIGINPNIPNDKSQYPLHFAAFKKHPYVVRVMLDSGLCDTLVKDRKGRTPAEDTSVQGICDMILEYRAAAQEQVDACVTSTHID